MLTEDNTQVVEYESLEQKAIQYLDQGNYVQAIAIYEQCIEADPTYISNYWYLGLALLLEEKKLEAESVWLSAIAQIETDEIENHLTDLKQILTEAAAKYFKLLDFIKTETIYWQILQIDPNSILAYVNLGIIFDYQNRLDEAIECFQRVIDIKPDCAEAYNNLGFVLIKQHKLEESSIYLRKSLEILPNYTKASNNLSYVLEVIKGQNAGYAAKLGIGYRTWDPWLLKDGDIYRLFYLTSDDKSPHFWCAGEVGAAISTNLQEWNYLGIVHKPDPKSEWESGRILAGNVYKENGIYYLFYPASPPGKSFLHEKIGLAKSIDGEHWERCSNFILQSDTSFYNCSCNFQFSRKEVFNIDEHWQWRDPCIVKESATGKYYMFITAASCKGSIYFRGCIGLAVADNIEGPYHILPPASHPVIEGTDEGIFYEMERPQVIYKNNQYNLFFSCRKNLLNPKWLEKIGAEGITDSSLYWFISDKITGPYLPSREKPVVKGSEKTSLYATNFIEGFNGELIAYGWYSQSHTLEVSPRFIVEWEQDYIEILENESY